MSIDFMKFGLELQAASLGKGPLAKPVPDYRPVEKVCPGCGRKHWRAAFDLCLSCSAME